MIGAIAESLGVHLSDHISHPTSRLDFSLGKNREVTDLGRHKEHRRGVRTGRDAGAATDARGSIHSKFSDGFLYRDGVGIGGATGIDRDETTGSDDSIEGRAIDHEVLEDRKGPGPKRFDPDLVSIVELPHTQFAGGTAAPGTMREAVDDEGTSAADALAAVVIEVDRLNALFDEILVEYIEHFKK